MPTDQVAEIKSKIDIVELISSYLPLKKAGKNYKGSCPFHTEKTASFMISPELQIFKCFGCGESGDIFTFVQKMEGLEFFDTLKLLGDRVGVKVETKKASPQSSRKKRLFEINELASKYFQYLLTQHNVGKQALKYLYNRGLTDQAITDFGIGYSPNSWSSLGEFLQKKKHTLEDIVASGLAVKKEGRHGFYDRFRGRIMFPLRNAHSKTVGFTGRVLVETEKSPKYLNTPETLIFKKSDFLYGLDLAKGAIRQEGIVIITEGQTDCISANQHGTKNIVAASGTALTRNQIKLLSRYTTNIAICFDTDAAGDTAARRGFELAEKEGLDVFAIILPKQHKDTDECVRGDLELWKKVSSQPVPVYDFYFESALSKFDPTTPLGKKKIGEFLVPVIKSISNEFQRSAYVTKLASILNVHESIVLESLNKLSDAGYQKQKDSKEFKKPTQNLEEYVLTLILHAPFDVAKTSAYKLGQDDFSNLKLQELFTLFKKGLRERTRSFAIKTFRGTLNNIQIALLDKLYLQDLGTLTTSPEMLTDELKIVTKSLKRRSTRRELTELSTKIKQAEIAKNKDLIKELQERFREVSGKL